MIKRIIGVVIIFVIGCSLAACTLPFSLGSDPSTTNNSDYIKENAELQKEIDRLNNQLEALKDDEITYADVMESINETSIESIKSNVMVVTTGYKTAFGMRYDGIGGQGSGVIFCQSDDGKTYYVLTNNHVTYIDPSYNFVYYQIRDYKDNNYSGTLVASSADYDLAILKFKRADEELKALPIAEENPSVDEIVIAMGQPEGQNNSVTIGRIQEYSKITLDEVSIDESNVLFEVIKHTAPINHGSSGGVLINLAGEIVGINFGGSFDANEEFMYGLSIPLEKAIEYLKEQGFKIG